MKISGYNGYIGGSKAARDIVVINNCRGAIGDSISQLQQCMSYSKKST